MFVIGRKTACAVLACLPLLVINPASGHEIRFGNLTIVHPWARPLPDAPDVLAGYLKVINNGKEDDRLIAATAEIAGSAMFEDMNMDNGVMKASVMAGGIPIPAGKTVALSSKSMHIMFQHVASQPMEGTEFQGTLTFEKAGTITVDFEVDEMAAH
jgi:copper(I)-binding protein